jgi:two-component system nitrogen regulation response regulator GlnG
VIASTERDLTETVAEDTFSRELYEVLAVVTLRLPPLRDRRDDIAVLVRHFIQRFDEELDRRIKGVDDQVLRRLQEHPWPGNVGELESVIKRACIVTRSDVITLEDIGESISDSRFPGRQELESALSRAVRVALQERIAESRAGASSSAFHDIVSLVETTLVREALTITNGNQVKGAELLGVNRATLRKKTLSE